MALRREGQTFGNFVERIVPGDRDKGIMPPALLADPPQRHRQPLGMMLALGIAGDLGADDALRIGLPRGAMDPADMQGIHTFDRQRAGARAIVRADTVSDVERHSSALDLARNFVI